MGHKKWNIGWGTVSACNMKCEFCYSKTRRIPDKDLGLTEWLTFVDNNWEYINSINYGTGENSISADWFTLIDHVRKHYPHIRQAVTTNGYIGNVVNNNPTKRDIVLRAIDEIDISLDFADEQKHISFRGQANAYKWALETLDFCQKNGKSPTIVCLGSAVNAYPENLNGIFAIAKRYGAIVRMNLYRPTEGIDDFSRRFILSSEKLEQVLFWINENHTILSISDVLYSNLFTENSKHDPSGFDSLRILPDGDVSPSTYLIHHEFIVGNIREKNILQRITEEQSFEHIVYDVIPDECRECRYRDTCRGGVFDRRYLWYGTLTKKDPYCHYQPGDPEWKKLNISTRPFHSVHNGYLPTMFFLPGKEGEQK